MNRRRLLLLLPALAVALVVAITTYSPAPQNLRPERPSTPEAAEAGAQPGEQEAGIEPSRGDGCVVSGHVRDPGGEPVAGVCVGQREGLTRACSDDEGAFRLIGLMPGHPYEIGVLSGAVGDSGFIEVVFTKPGEERRLDFEVPSPAKRRLLVEVRFSHPPLADPELSFDLGGARPELIVLPPRDSILACPAPLAAGQEVEVTATCPGFAVATKRVVMPEQEGPVRVTLTLTPGGLPLHGRVVDSTGNPVAGAEVHGFPTPHADSHERWSARTDRRGRFRLDRGVGGLHLVAFIQAERASRWLHLTPDRKEVVLVLEEAGVVTGRVLDQQSGTPVEGVAVTLSFDIHNNRRWTVQTNPGGSYRFAGVPTGSFVWPWIGSTPRADPVEPRPGGHFDNDPRSKTEAVEKGLARVLENHGDVFKRDIAAIRHPGGNCRFILQFPEGAPPPKSVQVRHESNSERWERRTTWEAEIGATDPVVEIWLGQGTHSVTFRAGTGHASVTGLEVRGDGDLPDRTVTFTELARVLVQLVEADGTPLLREGVDVHPAFMDDNSGSGGGSKPTDAAGRADVTTLLPSVSEMQQEDLRIIFTLRGKGLLAASPFKSNPNFSIPGPELADRIAAGGEVVLPVPARRRPPVLLLTVDADGNPVPGVRLTCSPADQYEAAALVTDTSGQATVHLHFDLKWLGFSRSIQAELPWIGGVGVDPSQRNPRYLTRDGKKFLVIKVQRAREVTVRVVDQNGVPLRGVEISDQKYDDETPVITDGNGLGRLFVVEGRTELFSHLPGYRTERFEVPPGVGEVTHRMTRLRQVSIMVQAPEQLAAESSLLVDASGGGRWELARGQDGIFRGEAGLPVGTGAEFTVISPDRHFEARANVSPAEDSVELTLAPRRLFPVTFQCLDWRGKPIPDLVGRIVPDYVSRDVEVFLTEEIRADREGRFTAKLPAGRMEIRIDSKDLKIESIGREFTVPAPEEVVLKFQMQ